MHAFFTSAAASVLAVGLALTPFATPHAAAVTATETVEPSPAPDSADVTWSVRPGDASGPDGRAWIEADADPGSERTEHLVVSNFGDSEVRFRLTAADGYFTDTGRFSMLPSDRVSTDAGTWISLPSSVTVPAGATEVVPFTIAVPSDATPGDHPAGVAASIVSVGSGAVGVESRVGFRVMTRVTGELRSEIATTVSADFSGSINPFAPGAVDVVYEITNTGNTRLRTQPVVSAAGPLGLLASEQPGEEIAEIAPGETRVGRVRVTTAWPAFWYDVRVAATPTAVSAELGVETPSTSSASTRVAAVPVSQLATIAFAIALLIAWLRQRRRRRAMTDRLIEEARAQGRAEAQVPAATEVSAAESDPVSPPAARRRRARSGAHSLVVALIGVAAVATSALPLDAWASSAETSGVEVRVDITPAPSASPTPSSTPIPAPSPSGSLPATGGEFSPDLLLAGVALVVVGIAGTASWRARRH